MKTLVLFLILFPVISEGQFIDGVVASVGNNVITVSEVISESKITKVLNHRGRVALPVEGKYGNEVMDQIINRHLIFNEAIRFDIEWREVDIEEEINFFMGKFKTLSDYNIFLKQEGISADTLMERFKIGKVVTNFVAEKLSIMTYVNTEEIEEFYEKNQEKYNGLELLDVEKDIKSILLEKKQGEFLDSWVAELRQRGNIRYAELPPEIFPF